MPTTRSPWSQNAEQKRLMTGVLEKNQGIPQFYFWYTALQLELLVFSFVKSLREANFALYVDCLTKLTLWFFSLDHTNYARWVPVHICDMVSLSTIKPEAAMEFMNGNFTVRKTNSVLLHGSGPGTWAKQCRCKEWRWCCWTYSIPRGFRRWMVVGPELLKMTSEFEASLERKHNKPPWAVQEFPDDFGKQVK